MILTVVFEWVAARFSFLGMKFGSLSYSSPYIRVFYFWLGMMVADIYSNNRIQEVKIEYPVIILVGFWFLARNSMELNTVVLRWIDVTMAVLLTYVAAVGNGKVMGDLLRRNLISKYGRNSIYYYLVQFPVIYVVLDIAKIINISSSYLWFYELIAIVVLICIMAKCLECFTVFLGAEP